MLLPCNVALKIEDVGINRTVVANLDGSALGVVEEMHPVVAAMQVGQLFAVQDVTGFYAVHDFCYTQTVVIVPILNGHAVLHHLGELTTGSPRISPSAVVQGIADCVVGDAQNALLCKNPCVTFAIRGSHRGEVNTLYKFTDYALWFTPSFLPFHILHT